MTALPWHAPDRVRALVSELEEHARRETALLYPWTVHALDGAACDSFRWAHDGERGCECCAAWPVTRVVTR